MASGLNYPVSKERIMRSWINNASIRMTIALSVGVSLLLLAVVFIAYTSVNLASKEKELVQNEALQIAQVNAHSVEMRIRDAKSATHTLAAAFSSVKEAGDHLTRSEVSSMLKRALVDNPGLVNTYTSWQPGIFDNQKDPKYGDWFWMWWTRQDNQITQVMVNTDFKTDSSYDYYTCPQKSSQDCVVEPYLYTDPATNNKIWLATVASPIVVKGQVVGVVTFDVQVDFFQTLMDTTGIFGG
jgi:hypothetical protein